MSGYSSDSKLFCIDATYSVNGSNDNEDEERREKGQRKSRKIGIGDPGQDADADEDGDGDDDEGVGEDSNEDDYFDDYGDDITLFSDEFGGGADHEGKKNKINSQDRSRRPTVIIFECLPTNTKSLGNENRGLF